MNKTEIAAALRQEVGELEASIKKLQKRCDKLKQFVIDLEEEIEAANGLNKKPVAESKFRKVIDQVFGEAPKQRKSR